MKKAVYQYPDLWQYLQASNRPIVLYGMGNGADKIIDVLAKYGLSPAGVFASDGFARGQLFHSMPVGTFDEMCARFGIENMIVLVCFASSIPSVMEQITAVAAKCETYIPDVPVRGTTVFDAAFAQEHAKEMQEAAALLADERSKEVFFGILQYRRYGVPEDLRATEDDRMQTLQTLLHFDSYRRAVDLGAYDGDTARELLSVCPHLETVYAWEPDRRNFRRLTERNADPRIHPVNAAAWFEDTEIVFDDAGNRNAGHVDGSVQVKRCASVSARKPDSLHTNEAIDYIKYDVEGSEKEALIGSQTILQTQAPDVLLSLYHRTEDIFALVLQLHTIQPSYRLYLRRFPYIPAWDLCLLAGTR